jgi:DeoR family transcriptional regulator, fructose operon transcriptional repressor
METSGVLMNYLPQNRRDEIINILKSKEYAEISYLSQKFSVSEMTIRRDIEKLEKEGKLIKVYGGVRLKEIREGEYGGSVDERKHINTQAKKAIAKEAVKFINDGDVIAFDASTTALEVSLQIKFKKRVTVVTNNINIAVELAEDPDITIILLGGFVRKRSLSLTGSLVSKYLESIFIDKAFISSKAINFNDGMTDSLIDEGEAKQALILRSNKLFALHDHSKIDTLAFFKVCPAEKINTFITDSQSPLNDKQSECLESYRNIGVEVITAP